VSYRQNGGLSSSRNIDGILQLTLILHR